MSLLWPDETQTLLLHAALDEGPAALEAFRRWTTRVDIDRDLDHGSFRLLPLLYSNLKRAGCDDPVMGRLQGIYRYAWVGVQPVLRASSEAITLLEAAAIPTLVSKGLALGLCHYGSVAERPMADGDIIVPKARAVEAFARLAEAGWRPSPPSREPLTPRLLAGSHAIGLINDAGVELDLHWQPSHELGSAQAVDSFWRDAVPMKVLGAQTLRPSATHLLLHLTLHGLRRNDLSPLRWIADAAVLLRREGPNIDWDALIAFAARERLLSRLGQALAFLHDEMRLPIPAQAVAAAGAPPSLVERIENWAVLEEPNRAGLLRLVNPTILATTARLGANGRPRDAARFAMTWYLTRRPWRRAS